MNDASPTGPRPPPADDDAWARARLAGLALSPPVLEAAVRAYQQPAAAAGSRDAALAEALAEVLGGTPGGSRIEREAFETVRQWRLRTAHRESEAEERALRRRLRHLARQALDLGGRPRSLARFVWAEEISVWRRAEALARAASAAAERGGDDVAADPEALARRIDAYLQAPDGLRALGLRDGRARTIRRVYENAARALAPDEADAPPPDRDALVAVLLPRASAEDVHAALAAAAREEPGLAPASVRSFRARYGHVSEHFFAWMRRAGQLLLGAWLALRSRRAAAASLAGGLVVAVLLAGRGSSPAGLPAGAPRSISSAAQPGPHPPPADRAEGAARPRIHPPPAPGSSPQTPPGRGPADAGTAAPFAPPDRAGARPAPGAASRVAAPPEPQPTAPSAPDGLEPPQPPPTAGSPSVAAELDLVRQLQELSADGHADRVAFEADRFSEAEGDETELANLRGLARLFAADALAEANPDLYRRGIELLADPALRGRRREVAAAVLRMARRMDRCPEASAAVA